MTTKHCYQINGESMSDIILSKFNMHNKHDAIVMAASITLRIFMNMLCLFQGNLMGISLICQDVFRAKDFMIFVSQTKGSFARGVRDFLGINEMPLC